MKNSTDFQYIDTQQALAGLCEKLAGCNWLAVDTEFLREKTYFPKFCLLQVATPNIAACVDPIALEGKLAPLLDIIYNKMIIKVFHAAYQDMEIFYHLRGELPGPVFDTQLAAPLLNYPEQAAYAKLVSDILGVTLSKAHTRVDWSRRPLSGDRLRYAADDVIYLCKLYQHLHKELSARGRLEWLEDDFARLSDTSLYSNPSEHAWQRIRAAKRLRGQQLAILQVLAAWREETARSQDRPRKWVISDDALLDIARLCPESLEELENLRSIPASPLKKHGPQIVALVEKAIKQPPVSLPVQKPVRLKKDQAAIVETLMAVVHLRGTQQALNPAIITSRKELERLVSGEKDLEILKGWKKDIVGEELQAILQGKRCLRIDDGHLQVSETTQ